MLRSLLRNPLGLVGGGLLLLVVLVAVLAVVLGIAVYLRWFAVLLAEPGEAGPLAASSPGGMAYQREGA